MKYNLDSYMIEVENFLVLAEKNRNVSQVLSELVR